MYICMLKLFQIKCFRQNQIRRSFSCFLTYQNLPSQVQLVLFAANFLKLMNFVFNESTQCFKLQQPFLKRAVFLDTSLILSLTHFQILSFPTDLILLRPFLKKNPSCIISFSMYFYSKCLNNFLK